MMLRTGRTRNSLLRFQLLTLPFSKFTAQALYEPWGEISRYPRRPAEGLPDQRGNCAGPGRHEPEVSSCAHIGGLVGQRRDQIIKRVGPAAVTAGRQARSRSVSAILWPGGRCYR